jgi:hypothetical protein
LTNIALSIAARLIFALVVFLTSFYCLLAYPSFTYQQVIRLELVTWLPIFVKFQPYLYLVSSILLTPTLPTKNKKIKNFIYFFILASNGFGCWLIFNPLLSQIENNSKSLLFSFITSLPLFSLIFIDYINFFPKTILSPQQDLQTETKTFIALLKTSIFTSILYFIISQIRLNNIDFDVTFSQKIFILIWSYSNHLLLFMAVFVILTLIMSVSRLNAKNIIIEFLLVKISLILVIFYIFYNLIFTAISFTNYFAVFFASFFAILLITFFTSLSFLLAKDLTINNSLELLIKPIIYKTPINKKLQILLLMVLAITTYFLTAKFMALDWNFLFQKLIATVVYLLTFVIFYSSKQTFSKPIRTHSMLFFALISLFSYKSISLLQGKILWKNFDKTIYSVQLIEKYVGYDISARLIKDLFSVRQNDNSFYKFLQNSSNIAHNIKINPVDIKLVENFVSTSNNAEKPNIFIFAIDSLRQDYVSTYNKSVKFTPFIDSFAKESIVMEKSFTHYGATGLSEPSIWTGSLVIHKQYVTPFYPMNSLAKLLENENYQSFISLDSILETIIRPSDKITPIDKGISTQSLKFCKSLEELKEKILTREDKKKPIFVYTQPQNIHISVINKENRSILDKEDYSGFYAPYASRVKQLDKCFGDFINFLKLEGLFENSIIIFTSDHGDSLGEEGRFGHAYTIFPEILKIPLIIHLPNKLVKDFVWNTQNVAFSSDITPSLYYLLGHKPIVKNELFGRPLFTSTLEEQKSYLQDDYLVASSYGAVYGVLSNNGNFLYIADSVNFQDFFYDLTEDPKGQNNLVSPLIKREKEQTIIKHIKNINKFYQFTPSD